MHPVGSYCANIWRCTVHKTLKLKQMLLNYLNSKRLVSLSSLIHINVSGALVRTFSNNFVVRSKRNLIFVIRVKNLLSKEWTFRSIWYHSFIFGSAPIQCSSYSIWFCLYFSSFALGKWSNNTKCQATSCSLSTLLNWSFTGGRNAKCSVQRNMYFFQRCVVHISD